MIQDNPVVTNGVSISATIVLVKAFLSLGQSLNWWTLTEQQNADVAKFLEVLIPIVVVWIGTIWAARKTTPLSNPTDEDGVPLTRPDNSPAIGEIRAAQTEAIKMNKIITRGLDR